VFLETEGLDPRLYASCARRSRAPMADLHAAFRCGPTAAGTNPMSDDFASLPYRPCVGDDAGQCARAACSWANVSTTARLANRKATPGRCRRAGLTKAKSFILPRCANCTRKPALPPACVHDHRGKPRGTLLRSAARTARQALGSGRYRGQRQRWLLLRFNGEDAAGATLQHMSTPNSWNGNGLCRRNCPSLHRALQEARLSAGGRGIPRELI